MNSKFRWLTAGESHGKGLVTIVEGVPAGLPLSEDYIAADLARRQQGYGRGKRQQIEQDRAEIISGVRHGLTIGSPIALTMIVPFSLKPISTPVISACVSRSKV